MHPFNQIRAMPVDACSLIVAPFRVGLSVTLIVIGSGCELGERDRQDVSLPEGTPVEIEMRPALSVGVMEGDATQEFFDVVTPFSVKGQGLVVPEAGANVVRVFDESGELIRTLGGPGEGPGEFTGLQAAWPHADTIEAYDINLRRITRFFPDGSNQVIRLMDAPGSAEAVIPGRLDDGWAVMGIESAGTGRRDGMVVHWFGADGAYRGEIARTEGMARFSSPGGPSGPDPLSPRAVFAVAKGAVYVGETIEPSIRILDPAGILLEEVRWDPGDQAPPAEALERVVDLVRARSDPAEAAALRAYLHSFPLRDRISSFWDLIVDERGFVWVRPYDAALHSMALDGSPLGGPGPGGEWSILTAEGEEVGLIQVPAGLEPMWISNEWMVGIHRDPLGVESVRKHALRRQ